MQKLKSLKLAIAMGIVAMGADVAMAASPTLATSSFQVDAAVVGTPVTLQFSSVGLDQVLKNTTVYAHSNGATSVATGFQASDWYSVKIDGYTIGTSVSSGASITSGPALLNSATGEVGMISTPWIIQGNASQDYDNGNVRQLSGCTVNYVTSAQLTGINAIASSNSGATVAQIEMGLGQNAGVTGAGTGIAIRMDLPVCVIQAQGEVLNSFNNMETIAGVYVDRVTAPGNYQVTYQLTVDAM